MTNGFVNVNEFSPGALGSGAIDRNQCQELVGRLVTVVDYKGKAYDRQRLVGIETVCGCPRLILSHGFDSEVRVADIAFICAA